MIAESEDPESPLATDERIDISAMVAPIKRGRGRPRKVVSAPVEPMGQAATSSAEQEPNTTISDDLDLSDDPLPEDPPEYDGVLVPPVVKRGRGRPRKIPLASAESDEQDDVSPVERSREPVIDSWQIETVCRSPYCSGLIGGLPRNTARVTAVNEDGLIQTDSGACFRLGSLAPQYTIFWVDAIEQLRGWVTEFEESKA